MSNSKFQKKKIYSFIRRITSFESDTIQLCNVFHRMREVHHSCLLSLFLLFSLSESISCPFTQAQSNNLSCFFLCVRLSISPCIYHIVKNEPFAENSSANVMLDSFILVKKVLSFNDKGLCRVCGAEHRA